MKQFIIIFVLIFSSQYLFAADFSKFNEILRTNVSEKNLPLGGFETSFDYEKAKKDKNTQELINEQKKILSSFDINRLKTKNESLSFWINAYNFFMISTVIEKGFEANKISINSVKDLGSFFNPYKIFKKELHNIGGKLVSLDFMEKTMLLGNEYKEKGWKDARIHFAVNCASVGCPPLLNKIYSPKTLDQTLNENLKKAFKTPRHLSISGATLKLTSLFKWYKKDFEEHSGSIKSFIKNYVTEDTSKKISSTTNIEFIDYNWNLNSPKNMK